jgi:hypothetical protein
VVEDGRQDLASVELRIGQCTGDRQSGWYADQVQPQTPEEP